MSVIRLYTAAMIYDNQPAVTAAILRHDHGTGVDGINFSAGVTGKVDAFVKIVLTEHHTPTIRRRNTFPL